MLFVSSSTTFPCKGCLKDCRDLRTASYSLKLDGWYVTSLVHVPDASNICVVPPYPVLDASVSSCKSIAFLHKGVPFWEADHRKSALEFSSISRSDTHVDQEDNV